MDSINGIIALCVGIGLGFIYSINPINLIVKSSYALYGLVAFYFLKIAFLSILLYVILHHTQLNFILLISAFFTAVAICLARTILHARTSGT